MQVERGQDKLRNLAGEGGFHEGYIPWEVIMNDIMGDRRRVEDEEQLPNTGMPAEIERAFSSIFVEPFAMPVLVKPPAPRFRSILSCSLRRVGQPRLHAGHVLDIIYPQCAALCLEALQ